MIDAQIDNINSVLELHTIIMNELFNYVFDFNICHKPVYIESALNNCYNYLTITSENNNKSIYYFEQLNARLQLTMRDINQYIVNNNDSVQNDYKKTIDNDYYNALKIGMYNHNYIMNDTYNELSKNTEHYKKIIELLYLTQRLENGFVFTIRLMMKTNNIYSLCKKMLERYNRVAQYEKFIPKYSYYSPYYTHSDNDTFIINFHHMVKTMQVFIDNEHTAPATHQNITFNGILFSLQSMYTVAGVNAYNYNGYYDESNKHYCYDDSVEFSDKTINTESTNNA